MFIRHVALNTGHVRNSGQDEIDPVVMAALWPLIAKACAGKSALAVPIPAVAGYSFTARCSGRCTRSSPCRWPPIPRGSRRNRGMGCC